MPTNFERVASALDLLMARVTTKAPKTLDGRIGKKCRALRLAYSNNLLDPDREPIDYSKVTTQLAYLYRSLPAHADWVYKALEMAPMTFAEVFARGLVKIACVGGGPGSDMLGVIKFAELRGHTGAQLNFTVLDRETGWNPIRAALLETVQDSEISQRHQIIDLSVVNSGTDEWSFLTSDIFTFSFSLSEVWGYNGDGAVSAFIQKVLTSAKIGALFVYVDNGGDDFTPLMEAEFDQHSNFKLLASQNDETMRMSASEQRSILEDAYKDRFQGERTKMGGNVATRIWKKTK